MMEFEPIAEFRHNGLTVRADEKRGGGAFLYSTSKEGHDAHRPRREMQRLEDERSRCRGR